jgi:hypothetical protein
MRQCLRAELTVAGENISESSPRGQRLKWMRQQADRLDPLVESRRPFSTAGMKFGAGDPRLYLQEIPYAVRHLASP